LAEASTLSGLLIPPLISGRGPDSARESPLTEASGYATRRPPSSSFPRSRCKPCGLLAGLPVTIPKDPHQSLDPRCLRFPFGPGWAFRFRFPGRFPSELSASSFPLAFSPWPSASSLPLASSRRPGSFLPIRPVGGFPRRRDGKSRPSACSAQAHSL